MGVGITEHAVVFGPKLVGILTQPPERVETNDLPAMLLLNAGHIHRVGPNRLYVRIARQLAEHGFTAFRFDFSGIGDSRVSGSSTSFEERAQPELTAAMDCVSNKTNINSFVTLGICSGADMGLKLALRENRAVGAILVNGSWVSSTSLDHAVSLAGPRLKTRFYKKQLFRRKAWSRVLRLRSNFKVIPRLLQRTLVRKLSEKSGRDFELLPELEELVEQRAKVLGIFSEGSVAWDLLEMTGEAGRGLNKRENVSVEFIPECDHVFTSVDSQERLIGLINRWMTGTFHVGSCDVESVG